MLAASEMLIMPRKIFSSLWGLCLEVWSYRCHSLWRAAAPWDLGANSGGRRGLAL